jgi:hypothetical protein
MVVGPVAIGLERKADDAQIRNPNNFEIVIGYQPATTN